MKTSTSEFVTIGHPDKIADYISSHILDAVLRLDPIARYALEVQVKGHHVTLGGEVTCSRRVPFNQAWLETHVRNALEDIGYTSVYAENWGDNVNAIDPDTVQVHAFINYQSGDIDRGVTGNGGWGDQGIFFGLATDNPTTNRMPLDHFVAAKVGRGLFAAANDHAFGLDIKTQVTVADGEVTQVVAAVPVDEVMGGDDSREWITNEIRDLAGCENVILNGTGRYVCHGPIADCGTTGRKLAVDFYGGNCPIGGGSPWTKDPTKADVTLNLYARKVALRLQRELGGNIIVAISSVIGRPEISLTARDADTNATLRTWTESRSPSEIIEELHLREPRYAERCRKGLFFDIF